jgi:hypothetical protein
MTAALFVTAAAAARQFSEAMQQVATASARVGDAFAHLAETMRRRRDPRSAYGWNFAGDGAWQSDLCAAWVHDSCPLPDCCDCTCHPGGTER